MNTYTSSALSKISSLSLALLLAGCADRIFEHVMFQPAGKLPEQATPCDYFRNTGKSCEDIKVRELFFPSLDQETTLQALFFPNPNSNKVVVYFHGNGGHVYHRTSDNLKLSEIANTFILSYRGYGKSEGKPSEAGLYEDAAATMKYVREKLQFKPSNTYIYGRSLGAAVAIDAAQRQNYAGLILISPFLSGRAMAEERGLGWVPGLGKPFHSIGKVANVTSPALFIHGRQDKIVPFEQGRALYEAYPSRNKTFKTVEDGGHNPIRKGIGDKYWEWVREFVKRG